VTEFTRVTQPGPQEDQSVDVAPLLGAASRGDERAWGVLVDRYGRRIFALVKSRCGNSDVAEDITQSVFATVAAKLGAGEYVEQGRFEAWLFRVTMNRLRDYVRRVRRRPESVDAQALGDVRAADPESTPAADLARLRSAMERLPEADREIIELRHHGDMSFKDMADMLGEPIGTLLARHHRALRKLKELMERASLPAGGAT